MLAHQRAGSGRQDSAVVDALQLKAAVQVGQKFGAGGRMAAVVGTMGVVVDATARHQQHHGAWAPGGGAVNVGDRGKKNTKDMRTTLPFFKVTKINSHSEKITFYEIVHQVTGGGYLAGTCR